jgi:acetylornithine/succinyldiaminopimelate/putrescine aminotransferase
MYGHLNVNALPPEYPQFYQRSEGAHVWNVDGSEYIDMIRPGRARGLGDVHQERTGRHYNVPDGGQGCDRAQEGAGG